MATADAPKYIDLMNWIREQYRDKHSIKIGELEFTKETRKILFEAEGLLSRFARYN